MKITLNSFLNFEHPAGHYVFPQSHDCYEIILYLNGVGKTTIGEESFDISNNTIAIITPGTKHDEYCSENVEVFCCLFTFSGEFKLKDGLYNLDQPTQQPFVSKIHSILLEIQTEMRLKHNEFHNYLNFLMGQLIICFYRTQSPSRIYTNEINYVKSYIKENYNQKVDFQIFSEQIGYSYDRFRHIFKERTGHSPSKYLLNIRVSKAKELLKNTDYPINYIGKLTNLGDISRFIETFKSVTGITPLKFRKTVRTQSEHVYFLSPDKSNND